MKAINEHFEVGQQYYALVSKEVLVVSEVLQPGMYPSGSGGYHTLRSPMVRFRSEKTGLVHTPAALSWPSICCLPSDRQQKKKELVDRE